MVANSPNSRLKEFRKNVGLNQEEMANSLGLKQGSYSDIERGKVGLSGVITKLIKLYRVNPVWLLEGYGDMFIENEEPYFNDVSELTDEADRPDIEYQRGIFDLLDVIEAPGDEKLKKQILSDLKSLLGRFLLENSKLLQENSKLKEEVIRLLQKHQNLKKLLNG